MRSTNDLVAALRRAAVAEAKLARIAELCDRIEFGEATDLIDQLRPILDEKP